MRHISKINLNLLISLAIFAALLAYGFFYGQEIIRSPEQVRLGGVFGAKEVYGITQGVNVKGPKFLEVEIDPRKVSLGDIQHLAAKFEKPEEVGSVIAVTELDSSVKTIELKRGDDNVWSGEWKVEDTSTKTYHTTFVAKGKDGQENRFTMAWSDPCSGIPINPGGGTAYLSGSCSVSGADGIDNGNLNLNGQTLTINGGATFAWNPGYSITLNGTIAIAGQLKQTYVWAQDADNDGWSSGTLAAQDSQPGGYRRLYTASSLSDCNDGSASVYQNLSCYTDNDWDGYDSGYGSVCQGASCAQPYRSSSSGSDCNDSNASLTVLRTGYIDSDGDGRTGTYVSNSCVASVSGSSNDCNESNASVWNNGYGYDGDRDGYGTSGYGCNNGNYPYDATSGTDCNDGSASYYTTRTCYQDSDADGYTTGGGVGVCTGASCVSPWQGYRDSPYGSDCNDANASLWQYLTGYSDNDYDGYGDGPPYSVCSGSSLPSGWSSNASDCYNYNANAYPGQGGWFTTNRGDGSFDYNCSGALDYQYGTTIATVYTDKNGACTSNTIGWSACIPTCGTSNTYYYNTACATTVYTNGCH